MLETISFRQKLGSLRIRLLAASAVSLLGLTAVSGVLLYRVFDGQAREHLRDRASVLARGAAAFLSIPDSGDGADRLRALNDWLKLDPDFASLHLLGDKGYVLFSSLHAPANSRSSEIEAFAAVSPAIRGDRVLDVQVVLSPERLVQDLHNLQWLSAAIGLLAGALFAALSVYFTRGVVLPLEAIRRAAHRIVNGESNVRVPVSGDLELDEVAHFFQALAERRTGIVPDLPSSKSSALPRTAGG